MKCHYILDKQVRQTPFLKIGFIAYFIFLLTACFFVSPYRDTFYYWEWSRHLALSYFDGPPMIAYVIRISTELFGNTIFALNFVGLCTVSLSAWFVFRIAELIADKKAAWLALVLWITAPIVNQELISRVTYDNVENLFWAASLYYVIHFLKTNITADIYKFASSAGMLLLSKYTGIVLLLTVLFYFVAQRDYRYIFKTAQFYLALLIILLLISPILIWNYHHDWVSLHYQLNIHKIGVINYVNNAPVYGAAIVTAYSHMSNTLHYLAAIIANFHIILIIVILGLINSKDKPVELRFLIWACAAFLLIWLPISAFAELAANYTMPLYLMMSILAAYFIHRFNWGLFATFLISLFLIIDLSATLTHVSGFSINTREMNYLLAKQADAIYQSNPLPVITPHYVAAEQIGYWLKGQPQVYVLSCGLPANQYGLLQRNFMAKLTGHQLKQAWFFDYKNEPFCIQAYFKTCQEWPTLTITKKMPLTHQQSQAQLYVYQCTN